MMLTDTQIRRYVAQPERDFDIDPFDKSQVQPASYDLTLGKTLIWYEDGETLSLGDESPDGGVEYDISDDPHSLRPGEFTLAHTTETVSLTNRVSAAVKGRSSIGRLGLIPHTAGWIDPGFEGQITLELVNHGPHVIEMEAGDPIAQIVFAKTDSRVVEPYGAQTDSKYQGQTGVTESRIGGGAE
jgi:dCTP deaminase